MRPVNTQNPTSVADFDALIEEVKQNNWSHPAKVAKLKWVWDVMGNTAWSITHKELAQEVRYKAYDVAQLFGGF